MDTQELRQDFFISHASRDKEQYIQPLVRELTARSVTYWLDSVEIPWGDKLAIKINDGLRQSNYFLLCLSRNFLGRSWPEIEMNAALSMQTDDGKKRVLPLILDSKEQVLRWYPIIRGLVYREFDEGFSKIADELAKLASKQVIPPEYIHVTIESLHTGQLSNVVVPQRASIKWLAERARQGAGLHDKARTGGFEDFAIRWVLVDAQVDEIWEKMPRRLKRRVRAIIKSGNDIRVSERDTDRLEELGVYQNIVLHLYAIEDEDYPPPAHMASVIDYL